MKNYELTLVLPGKAKSKEKSYNEKIEKLVKVTDGKVSKTESWGEINLSYLIKKEKSGYFLHYNLELDGKAVKSLDDKLRIDDGLLRYLLVKSE